MPTNVTFKKSQNLFSQSRNREALSDLIDIPFRMSIDAFVFAYIKHYRMVGRLYIMVSSFELPNGDKLNGIIRSLFGDGDGAFACDVKL